MLGHFIGATQNQPASQLQSLTFLSYTLQKISKGSVTNAASRTYLMSMPSAAGSPREYELNIPGQKSRKQVTRKCTCEDYDLREKE